MYIQSLIVFTITATLQLLDDACTPKYSLGKLAVLVWVCVCARVCRPKLNDCLHLHRLRLESALFFG